jgi:hypothetical protein
MTISKITKKNKGGGGCSQTQFIQIYNEILEQPAWRARADREADYYDGNQLDSDILELQKERGIPPSIENLIGRTVDDICGMEAKNRTDWKVIPATEESEDDVAEALSAKLNQAERESGADRACSKGYSYLTKVGISWAEVSRNRNPFGYQYKTRFVHRNEIFWDMTSREPDLSDCMWIVRRRWIPTEMAKVLFPGSRKVITDIGSGGWGGMDYYLSSEGGRSTDLAASLDIERGWSVEEQEWLNLEDNKVCIYEVHTRHFREAKVLHTPDGRVVEFDKKNPAHAQACLCGFDVENRLVSDIYCTFFLGPFVLGARKEYGFRERFRYIPFFGNIEDRTGVPYGVIRNLMYLQDEVNARISKMQWGLAAMRVERTEGALAMSEEVFRKVIARPDADIKLNRKEMQAGGIFRVERDFNLTQQQYERLIDLRNSINKVSGVTEAFQGHGGNSTAAGLQAQIEQSIQSLAVINDNFRYSRQLLGEYLLDLIIHDTGEEEEVVLPGGILKGKRRVVLNQRVIDQETGIEYKNNDVTRTRLKVVLSEVPTSPSFRSQQLSSLSEAFKSAPAQYQTIMMPHLLNLMDIPHKQEIVDAVREMSSNPSPEEIEERIKQAVEQALVKAKVKQADRELDIKERLTAAQIEKITNEAVNKAVDAMYSAMQAAGVIAQNQAIAPLGDTILKSSGFKDKDAPPLVPEYPGGELPPGGGQVTGQVNTNPTTPVPSGQPEPDGLQAEEAIEPESPAVGQAEGIETQEID